MEIIRTVAELQAKLGEARSRGTIGLVPTMGALHAGHLSLIERAREENDTVVVSVFVNPTQFNNPTDLATYPRTEEADAALMEGAGVDYGLEIVDCPIKRETDGLALSSRNVRLSAEQRSVAPVIAQVLRSSLIKAREMSLADTKKWVTDTINVFPFMNVEYYEIVDALTMQPIAEWSESEQPVGCITVFCGDVRLIDNIKYVR